MNYIIHAKRIAGLAHGNKQFSTRKTEESNLIILALLLNLQWKYKKCQTIITRCCLV